MRIIYVTIIDFMGWPAYTNISCERWEEEESWPRKENSHFRSSLCCMRGFIGAAGQIYANTTHSSNKVANPFGESLLAARVASGSKRDTRRLMRWMMSGTQERHAHTPRDWCARGNLKWDLAGNWWFIGLMRQFTTWVALVNDFWLEFKGRVVYFKAVLLMWCGAHWPWMSLCLQRCK